MRMHKMWIFMRFHFGYYVYCDSGSFGEWSFCFHSCHWLCCKSINIMAFPIGLNNKIYVAMMWRMSTNSSTDTCKYRRPSQMLLTTGQAQHQSNKSKMHKMTNKLSGEKMWINIKMYPLGMVNGKRSTKRKETWRAEGGQNSIVLE